MKALAKELGVVIPVSFYEAGEGRQLFNSVAVIDADGEVLGIYRKTHIPDDHYYQEKFYFTPGNTGFKAFKTRYATIGVGICWDQWFPETARGMALKGAEILFYPTAIGSEPILECDSMPHWRRCMTGHAACNLMPVVAANRIGTEEVVPCAENGNQSSALTFYGSSFITDATGEVVEQMDRVTEGFILHSFDLDELESERRLAGISVRCIRIKAISKDAGMVIETSNAPRQLPKNRISTITTNAIPINSVWETVSKVVSTRLVRSRKVCIRTPSGKIS